MPTVIRETSSIHYDDRGSGPAVVFLHNLGGDGGVFGAQLEALSGAHRTIAIDLPGHGESSPLRARPSFEELVMDVKAVLEAAGVGRAVFVGVSLGGMLALRLALAAPDAVAGLVLVSTDPRAPSAASRFKLWLLRAALLLLGKRALGGAARSLVGATTEAERPAVLSRLAQIIGRAHLRSLRLFAQMLAARTDVGAELARIAAPVAIVLGAEDRTLPVARGRELAALMPGAELSELRGAGHLAPMELPDEVAAVIRGVLAVAR